jgi:acyl CoA:acetate/3-ketoacid CoA transferase alpha subunit
MYDGAMKKITQLNGEIDTLNMSMNLWIEKSKIFEIKYSEAQKEIKKHKTGKIWIPIVAGAVGIGVGYGIGRAIK